MLELLELLLLLLQILLRLRADLPPVAGIGVLFERLQFGQRYDVTFARPMPDGLLRGSIIVIETLRIRIEEFPPLR